MDPLIGGRSVGPDVTNSVFRGNIEAVATMTSNSQTLDNSKSTNDFRPGVRATSRFGNPFIEQFCTVITLRASLVFHILASRLCDEAKSGQILISPAC